MNLNSKSELEKYFADHFDTVLFPVLADIYKTEGDLSRARKVCEIGLEYHPNNVEGTFILAEIHQATGDLAAAEKLLKNVLALEPKHYRAAVNLAEIGLKLKRAPDSIARLWYRISKIDPTHPTVKQYILKNKQQKNTTEIDRESIESQNLKKEFDRLKQKEELKTDQDPKHEKKTSTKPKPSAKPKTTKIKAEPVEEIIENEDKIFGPKPPSIKPQKINEEELQSLNISPRMATFTMVNVLKKQKLYQQAIAVLALLEEKGADPALISQERQNLQKLIQDSETQ